MKKNRKSEYRKVVESKPRSIPAVPAVRSDSNNLKPFPGDDVIHKDNNIFIYI